MSPRKAYHHAHPLKPAVFDQIRLEKHEELAKRVEQGGAATLPDMPERTFFGRPPGSGAGKPMVLNPSQIRDTIGLYSEGARGLVPAGGQAGQVLAATGWSYALADQIDVVAALQAKVAELEAEVATLQARIAALEAGVPPDRPEAWADGTLWSDGTGWAEAA